MKKILYMLACTLAVAGCYNEDKITPTEGMSVAGKFAFPQEGTPADVQAVLDDIYATYGTKVIYKDFTEADLKRSWMGGTTSSTTTYTWDWLEGADLLAAVTTLRDKALSLMPLEITRAGLARYPYIFLVDNLTENNLQSGVSTIIAEYPVKALDAMTVNMQVDATTDNQRQKVGFPLNVADNIFTQALYVEAIEVPARFREIEPTLENGLIRSFYGASQTTAERYWARQGAMFNVSNGQVWIGKHTMQRLGSKDNPEHHAFMFLCLVPQWKTLLAGAPGTVDTTVDGVFYDCPLLIEKLEVFQEAMEAQGMDFEAMNAALYTGTTIDTSTSRVYLHERGVLTDPNESHAYLYYDFNND